MYPFWVSDNINMAICAVGISLDHSNRNNLIGNTLKSNKGNGITVEFESNGNTLRDNTANSWVLQVISHMTSRPCKKGSNCTSVMLVECVFPCPFADYNNSNSGLL
jgi:parallel beta-helix repeat protein